ncbi:hypothetical protein [Noviherbaspirillum aerium]|nr:hypothetical protein [Noviherbaspirillum aerium]
MGKSLHNRIRLKSRASYLKLPAMRSAALGVSASIALLVLAMKKFR